MGTPDSLPIRDKLRRRRRRLPRHRVHSPTGGAPRPARGRAVPSPVRTTTCHAHRRWRKPPGPARVEVAVADPPTPARPPPAGRSSRQSRDCVSTAVASRTGRDWPRKESLAPSSQIRPRSARSAGRVQHGKSARPRKMPGVLHEKQRLPSGASGRAERHAGGESRGVARSGRCDGVASRAGRKRCEKEGRSQRRPPS